MKQISSFLFAAALVLSAAACEGVKGPEGARTVTFEATAGNETKAVLDRNSAGNPQIFWEDGDQITVYTQADGDSGNQRGYEFTTSLGSNATSATFTYTGEGCAEGNYLAIFPAASAKRAVNFTGSGEIYKMASVDVPSSQNLVAGSFDRTAAVMTAFAPAGSRTLHFKNAVALLKFRVSGNDIVSGSIVADASDILTGRFRADLDISSPYLPVLTTYAQGSTCNYVEFTVDGSTPLVPDTDYYVAVRPTDLTDGLKVYLNGALVKTLTASQAPVLERSMIYNLGTLSAPTGPKSLELTFDFSVDPLSGWPTDQNKAEYPHKEGGMECIYPLGGVDYSFVLADCGGATNTSAQLFWHTSTKALVFNAQKRYLGFPALDGYKLTKVACYKKSGATDSKFEIVKSISPNTDHPADTEIVAEPQVWNTNDKTYVYYLTGTKEATRYYLYALVKGSVSSLTLTYEPV